jgi:hypothetical protein
VAHDGRQPLEPVPVDRFRGAYPHQLSSYDFEKRLKKNLYKIGSLTQRLRSIPLSDNFLLADDPLTDDLAAKHYAVRDGLLRCVAVAGCSDLARRRILKQPFEIGNQPEGPLTVAHLIASERPMAKFSWLADHGR